jgi:hypothetical protein
MSIYYKAIAAAIIVLILVTGCRELELADTPVPPYEEGTDKVTDSIAIPSGNPPTIDGTLSPGEWEQATVETFADGHKLLLMRAGGYLYLAIRANTPGMIAGNVFIQHGNEIAILHSSAALGTAIYQQDEDNWQQIQDFTWRLRQTGQSSSAEAERDRFLEQEGWIAANSRMGIPEELEYRIEIAEDTLRLAANIIRTPDPNEKIPWPANLEDDVIKPTPGGLPENLYFSPEEWATLEVSR